MSASRRILSSLLPRTAQVVARRWIAFVVLLGMVSPAPAQFLRLEDVAAGGDGSGNAPTANTGIDPRTGAFTNGYFTGHISDTDGVNPASVPGSPYIDSVFLLKGKVPTADDGCGGCFVQYITQSGVQLWLDDTEETNTGWNFILKDRNGGVSDPGIKVGAVPFGTALGIHSSMGITFDLEALRVKHGDAAVGCFTTYWGMDGCAGGFVTLYAMLSDQVGVTDIRTRAFAPNEAEWLSMEIPRQSRYLTLVTAASGADACDHGTFARPVISSQPCLSPSFSWVWSVSPSRVSPAGEAIALRGELLDLVRTVRVGGIDLTSQTHFGSDGYSGVTPPLPPGFYDLDVVEDFSGDTLHLSRAIEVTPPPTLTAILPSEVLEDRPIPVSILGTNLRSDMEIWVDDVGFDNVGVPIGNLTFLSGVQFAGTTPPYANGAFNPGHRFTPDVLLYDQGRLHIFSGLLTYVGTGIEKVEPNIVSTEGGTVVTFVGAGFHGGMRFDLGGTLLLDMVVLDAGHARGTSPPLPEGLHSARITLVDGFEIIPIFTLADAVQAVPSNVGPLAITNVSPARVLSLGGAEVTVVTNQPHGNVVPRVAGVPLANVASLDALTLRGEIAPLAPGVYDVDLVATVDGGETVAASAPSAIQVLADDQISITSVVPSIVSTLGGTEVTITGTGFSAGFVPRIGGIPLEQVEITEATRLRGVSPALEEGSHDASIASGDLVLAGLPSAVTALPPTAAAGMYIGHIRPSRISRNTSRVRFVGAELPGDAVPRIGGVPLESIIALSPCRIEGTAPNLPPGFYNADLYRPDFGIVAKFAELVEVADPGAPPRPAYVVSEPVRREGSTRAFFFGNDYSANTRITIGDKPLLDPIVVSDELIVGRVPALGSGEDLGLRDIVAADERGSSRLANGLRYVDPESQGSFVRADVNASGRVDLSDAVFILGYLFLGNPTRMNCFEAADANGNGAVDLTDAIFILQHLFLGGREPVAPYPSCGLPAQSVLGCESFSTCGAGGGGAAEGAGGGITFTGNFKLLRESAEQDGDATIVELAAEEGEILIRDPPGGKDVHAGDIIGGFTPIRSDAMHNGVAYLLKLEEPVAGSCLAATGAEQVYRVRPATMSELVVEGDVRLQLTDFFGGRQFQADRRSAQLDCLKEVGVGGGVADQGEGGSGAFFDVDFGAFGVLDLRDGDNYLRAGFYQSQVRYNSGMSLGFGIKGAELKRLTFFAGQLLESQIEFYVDAGLFTHIQKEVKLFNVEKGTIVFIGPVPVLFTGSIALYAGVNLDAGVTLYVDAGTAASYKAGIGFEFDGTTLRNISGFEEPKLSALPETPILNVDGFASVKGYIRPEIRVFGGLLVKALTGDIYMPMEVFGRAHVEGHTNPPCFQWGFDAGAKVTLQTEVQLFGFDLFDQTFVPVDENWPNLLGGSIGCKAAPVVKLKTSTESTATGLLIHLDASESYDPDGGPLRFLWDLYDDGKCRRDTGSDPRTTFFFNPASTPCLSATCEYVIRLRVMDDERTFTDRTTSFATIGTGSQVIRSKVRVP